MPFFMRCLLWLCICFLPLIRTAAPADLFVLPDGAGRKDGSSWANAAPAVSGGLQEAWNRVPVGGTLYIGSGLYRGITLHISEGGTSKRPKHLTGVDTGAGLPRFEDTFDRHRPNRTGQTFLQLGKAVGDLQVRDLNIHRYRMGIYSGEGQHRQLSFAGITITECREGISLNGGATEEEPDSGSRDITIANCIFTDYTKRAVRLYDGHRDVLLQNCYADGGGKTWATELFAIGFQVGGRGVPDRDITFIRCTSNNHYNDAGTHYWNSDGFVAESGSVNLTYIDCRARNNTDGGWDDKGSNSRLYHCLAVGNKRNYRFWGTAQLYNCVGALARHPGGSGNGCGLWAAGDVATRYSTFVRNPEQISVVERGTVVLEDSLLIAAAGQTTVSTDPDGRVSFIRSEIVEGEAHKTSSVAPDVQYSQYRESEFISQYGRRKGFHPERRKVTDQVAAVYRNNKVKP